MKKILIYIAAALLSLASCAPETITPGESAKPEADNWVKLPFDATEGELLIKFAPEMSDILDRALTKGGIKTRSGIPSTDEVLEILGGYHFERVFPVDTRTEEQTRKAGLHLWYLVRFDEGTNMQEAANNLARLGEISKVQANRKIQYVHKTDRKYLGEAALQAAARAAGTSFTDPGLKYQWHYHNTGSYPFDNQNSLGNSSVAGCDVNCFEAWEKCTGDPSIVVAILDEGVMNTHPDLEGNIWRNEAEINGTDGVDDDGNGLVDDKYGYNFVKDSGKITWTESMDSGHGTHIAGTIAAVNNNGTGVCGIAGGDGTADSGVKIMSCQVFANGSSVSLVGEVKAMKYAADNGATILQCSWGYNSAKANLVEGFSPGPGTEEEWEELYPIEKEAIDYFINNAGSPNGVIDGGIVIFASGNEYAGLSAFPGAYHKCLTVSGVAPDYTPASYTNYGTEVDVCAPGGDVEAYGRLGEDDPEYWTGTEYSASILSTLIKDGKPAYGYMDGTSMACPHASGVVALGLSYAVQQRRHFKAEDFIELVKKSVQPIDEHYRNGGVKSYYRNHVSIGGSPNKLRLGDYIGKMGTGLLDARMLLDNIDGTASGLEGPGGFDMKVPNIYVAEGGESTLDLAAYYAGGESLGYTCTSSDNTIASVSVAGTVMKVQGVKTGSARITVKPSAGSEQTIAVTVRKNAGGNGWM